MTQASKEKEQYLADFEPFGERVAQREAPWLRALRQDAISRFNFGETQPDQRINQFISQLGGVPGGNQTTTQPIFRNRALTGLGGALGGGSLGFNIGSGIGSIGGPLGGGIGAGLGGLLGLLLNN